ncbi:DNA translocase FtsK 4TM domain-containing protein [candidate division KSB1 bacterium]|nr:DNA translocase FtsK 4TM domain-containing protein [candidate division KSB1 bacterium]
MAPRSPKSQPSRPDASPASFLWGLALLVLAALVFLSVVSFSELDSPVWGEAHEHNWIGYSGTVMSYGLVTLGLGRWAAFGIAGLIGIWGWTLLRRLDWRKPLQHTLFIAVLTIWTSAFIGVIGQLFPLEATATFQHCGAFGFESAEQLRDFLGSFGAVAVLVVLVIATFALYIAGFAHWFESRVNTAIEKTAAVRVPKPGWFSRRDSDREHDPDLREPDEALPPLPPLLSSDRADGLPGRLIQNLAKPGASKKDKPASPAQLAIQIEDRTGYVFPPVDLFNASKSGTVIGMPPDEQQRNSELLEKTLATFGVQAKVVRVNPGPVITRFDLEPAPGVKVSRIEALADDIALALRARGLRIQAPIPGVAAVGVELANVKPAIVTFREVVESEQYQQSDTKLQIALGRTVQGEIFTADLGAMPHLLIAGTTGSGKSVCINTIIASILLRATPDDVQFVMIDPKKLELSAYNELRNHHVTHRPDLSEYVITRPDEAVKALRSCLLEMERRYDLLAERGARQLSEYNEIVRADPGELGDQPLPFIVVVIDELADLMVTAQREVEEPIARLAQLARAVGIHLVVATQRPSVDVITGVIKANFPARIAFRVAMKVDSRTILDTNGAEMLLGQGDMLFQHPEEPAPIRVQGALLTSQEISRVITHIVKQPAPRAKLVLPVEADEGGEGGGITLDAGDRDPLFMEAAKIVVRTGQGSVSILQRRLKVGYSRAARLIDQLERAGIVGPYDGSKARAVLVDEHFFDTEFND